MEIYLEIFLYNIIDVHVLYRLVVVVGDLNCCYGRIDSAYEEEEEVESVSEHCCCMSYVISHVT